MSYENIVDQNIEDNSINLYFYKIVLKLILFYEMKIHYGKFIFEDKKNFLYLLKTISQPSNFYEKITIIEGWSKSDLNLILSKNFEEFDQIEYYNVIADTYMFSEGSSFKEFKNILKNRFVKVKDKYKNNHLLKKFSFKEILIMGSLLEKEGINNYDKKKIFSVIMNRLNKKMKLQIDATVIFSLTKGLKKFDRNLIFKDLKIQDPYNTYFINGLPPEPISYVGHKTIELIFENYKTDYLFYFYNAIEKKHIFSKNYKNHLIKLNEYRSK